jgi:hypothetical protein
MIVRRVIVVERIYIYIRVQETPARGIGSSGEYLCLPGRWLLRVNPQAQKEQCRNGYYAPSPAARHGVITSFYEIFKPVRLVRSFSQ